MDEIVYESLLAEVSCRNHPYAKEGDLLLLTQKECRRILREYYIKPRAISGTMDVWRVAPEHNAVVGRACIYRKQRKRR